MILEFKHITKRFGGLFALEDISFDVAESEIVGLIGPNGAGKSTLFNVATAFYRPDSGRVLLQGKNITRKSAQAICRMGLSRTFQKVKVFLNLTAFENVLVNAVFGSTGGWKDAERRAIEALRLVGMIEKKDIITVNLSLSNRRLLETARALASNPSVVLLDEPMAGLTPEETVNMLQVIERTRQERNLAIIWIEHKQDAIFRLCDRVVVLDYGKMIGLGRPEEIAQNSVVKEAYLGKQIA